MYQINEFSQREQLDIALADKVAQLLAAAINDKGRASIAVSGGSTPKGFFAALSKKKLNWSAITVTLADERWVDIDDSASNTKLVQEHLLQNEAAKANFFHLKQGENLNVETLQTLCLLANEQLLPLDVLILGMGEDGHTASLFPCSEEITQCLASDSAELLSVQPATAPHQRITFSFATLAKSANTFLHISGSSKKQVLAQAIAGQEIHEMPIRAFLQAPDINTQVYWAE